MYKTWRNFIEKLPIELSELIIEHIILEQKTLYDYLLMEFEMSWVGKEKRNDTKKIVEICSNVKLIKKNIKCLKEYPLNINILELWKEDIIKKYNI